MRLRERTPKAALVVDVEQAELRDEPALAATGLWDPSRHVPEGTLPRAATIWADHVRRSTDDRTGATITRRVVSARALGAGVAVDDRTDL